MFKVALLLTLGKISTDVVAPLGPLQRRREVLTYCVQGDLVFGHALCFFLYPWQLPKVLILQSASARAGADRTFSDQYLGQVRGGQQMKKRERSQGLLRLVFLSCWLRVGPREDGTLYMGTLMM